MQITDELRVLVEAEVARAIENFKKLSEGVDESEEKTLSLGEALDSISKKSLIISGVFGAAGIAAVKLAGENEKLKLSLRNMLGSADEAAAVFEDWRRLGSSPGLSVDEVFSLGRAMANMGQSTQYATSTIQMLGNVAAGTGVSFGEISSAFERARAMGNLTTRDLVRLQQQGIPVVKQLSVELGVSEDRVRQLAAEGKISFAELEKAFRSMTDPGGQFAGMMDELSGTVLEKFSSAADDAKQALAAFGETLLPLAAELLTSASSILQGITDMDDGTKKFVVGMGAVIAVSGPAVKAVRGIHAAITMLTANPVILAMVATTAGIAGIFYAANDLSGQLNQAAKDYETSINQIVKNNQDLLASARSFDEVRSQIRGLTRDMYDAAVETGNFAAATEAAARLTSLNQQLIRARAQSEQSSTEILRQAQTLIRILEEPLNPNANSWWEGFATEVEKVNDALDMFNLSGYSDLQRYLTGIPDWVAAVAEKNSDAMLQVLKNINGRSPAVQTEIARIENEMAELARGATISPRIEIAVPVISDAKKRWQDWFGEITNIDPELFGSSGAEAARLYISTFERSFAAQNTIANVLNEQMDFSQILRIQQAELKKTLEDLFSIDPGQINRPFTIINDEINGLIAEYRRLGEEAKNAEFNKTIEGLITSIDNLGKSERQLVYEAELARLGLDAQSEAAQTLMQTMDNLSVSKTLAGLRQEVQNLGKDQYDLALAALAAANATEEVRREAEELIATLRRYNSVTDTLSGLRQEVQGLGKDQYDLALAALIAAGATEEERKEAEEMIETLRRYGQSFDELLTINISSGLMSIFSNLDKRAAETISNISAQLLMISFDGLLDGLSAVGEAFGAGGNAAENFAQAMAGLSRQILNQLPNMFLQAGLQLIAQGQWPLGLGFIAAAGSSAIISGYVNGAKSTTANAHGNIYDEYGTAARAFAAGGAFTNQIVSAPTYFKHGGGFGLMGEAGPEAIMPLTRMPNGDLGVAASGGGANITVNIINNTGADVRREEHTDADGNRQVDIIIGQIVNNHIMSGKADRAMARYNIRAAGV